MKNVPDAPTAMICPPIVEVTAIKEKLLPVTREKGIELIFKMLQLNKGTRMK